MLVMPEISAMCVNTAMTGMPGVRRMCGMTGKAGRLECLY